MKDAFLRKILSVTLGVLLIALYTPRLCAQDDPSDANDDVIDMVAGDIQAVPVNGLTRVSVTNPDVADISDAQNDKVSLLAKKTGETVLFLWDADGKRSIKVRVVNEDLTGVKERVERVLAEANITGLSLEENLDIGKVVITGAVTKEDKGRLENILGPYSDNLLNLVKEQKVEDLIQVDMQVIEISTTLEQQLGIQWGSSGNSGTSSNSSGGISTAGGATNSSSLASSAGTLALNYNENQPTGDTFGDLFKIGNFQRATPLEATVSALLQEGKAKLISKPRLVVISGKQASFLVGGEIPIENTTQNSTGTTQTTSTTYSQYGVNMTVTPTLRDGKIEVLLNVDIRDIDASNPVQGAISFITRTASTDLLMDNKQTIALAGLIKYSDSSTVTEVPYLSKIPILGLLFRSTNAPNNNTEMVIILTPTVLTDKKIADTQMVMPTPSERDAYQNLDSKYEHEPIVSNWPAPKVETATTPTDSVALTAMTAYARMVQVKISKSLSYPQAALGSSLSGTVKLKLHILKDGSLDSAVVMESSGNDILDQDAVQAAKAAAPFDGFTTEMDQEDLVFTIPIVYNKLIAGGQSPEGKS